MQEIKNRCTNMLVIQPVLEDAISMKKERKLIITKLEFLGSFKSLIGFKLFKYINPITKFKYIVKYPG